MRITKDYLLVRVEKLYEDEITLGDSGVTIKLGLGDTGALGDDNELIYNPNTRKRIYGTVEAVPDAISNQVISYESNGFPEPERGVSHDDLKAMGAETWLRQDLESGWNKIRNSYRSSSFENKTITLKQYEPDLLNIEIGDKVYFNYHATNDDSMVEPGLYKIRIDDIICCVSSHLTTDYIDYEGEVKEIGFRSYDIHTIAGHVIMKPLMITMEGTKTQSGIYTQQEDKPQPLRALVVHGYDYIKTDMVVVYLPDADCVETIEGQEVYVCKINDLIAEVTE